MPTHSMTPFQIFRAVLWLAIVGVSPTLCGQTTNSKYAGDSQIPIFRGRIESWSADPLMTDATERQLWQTLLKPYTPTAAQMPIDQWLREVAVYTPIHLDQMALNDNGLSADEKVDLWMGVQRPFIAHLLVALKPLDLTLMIEHGCVIVTTHETAEEDLSLRIYDLTPLLGPSGSTIEQWDGDSLINTIQTNVEPDSWDALGGSSSMRLMSVRDRGLVCISTTVIIHWKIIALLEQLAVAGRVEKTSTVGGPIRAESLRKSKSWKRDAVQNSRESNETIPRPGGLPRFEPAR